MFQLSNADHDETCAAKITSKLQTMQGLLWSLMGCSSTAVCTHGMKRDLIKLQFGQFQDLCFPFAPLSVKINVQFLAA